MKQILQLIGRRVIQLVPVALGATFVSFIMVNLQAGNVALGILGNGATPTSIAQFNRQYGLNHALLYRYFAWLWHALHGNFGQSYETQQSVYSEISQRFPVTLELVILALLIALLTAIPSSILVARRPMKFVDWTTRSVAMVGLSMPNFVLGAVLLFVFAVKIHLVPSIGYVPITQSLTGNLKIMILPAITLAFGFFATYTRILRGDMIDQIMSEEYVQTAKSKGLSEFRILIRHVFKNSIFSFITVLGTNLGVLIGGSVVIEQVFSLTGMGNLLQSSVLQKDAPVVQGLVAVICVAVVTANLLTDIAYMVLDPRIRYGSAT